MKYYISDLHFFHEKMNYEMDQRGFASVEDMHRYIIRRWNSKVNHRDEVVLLGDISFGKAEETNEVLKKLNGKLCLIIGNHDYRLLKKADFDQSRFEWIKDYYELEYESNFFMLFHYPLEEWNKFYRGAYHLHGHQHNNSLYNFENLKKGLRRYDVGVDANNFKPISIDEIIKFFEMI